MARPRHLDLLSNPDRLAKEMQGNGWRNHAPSFRVRQFDLAVSEGVAMMERATAPGGWATLAADAARGRKVCRDFPPPPPGEPCTQSVFRSLEDAALVRMHIELRVAVSQAYGEGIARRIREREESPAG